MGGDEGIDWTKVIATVTAVLLTSTALGWVVEQGIPHDGAESMVILQ